jgi:hypothetical protein
VNPKRPNFFNYSKAFLFSLLILGSAAFQAYAAAPPVRPVVSVRFANPQYDCPTQTYCLDVEFLADRPGQRLFGMNVRFFYDDDILEFLAMGDFAFGYESPDTAEIKLTDPGSEAFFGIAGPMEWVNANLYRNDTAVVYLSTTTWTKLFNVCFHVDDPNSINIKYFCPSIIWDLQQNPPEIGGGYWPGDDGVVITLVNPANYQNSIPSTENVIHYNWTYDNSGNLIGYPIQEDCTSTTCGYIIPLADWSLFLAIGLMIVATLFIYRRRISG